MSDTQSLSIRDATEADYNAASRSIEMKLEIYFDGLESEPCTITRDNYLIDADLLEETGADSENPFGTVSSNELSFSLYNSNGMLSPTNTDSPYYGKIQSGVPIKAYIRPTSETEEINWQPIGTFYVSNWQASVTGIIANISANDSLLDIFGKPRVKIPTIKNITMYDMYKAFFDALGIEASIDSSLTEKLIYGHNIQENKKFLSDLSVGAQAYVFCDRDGKPKVDYARGSKEVMHTLTDSNQIIDIMSEQGILTDYTGIEVVTNKPQESEVTSVLSITELNVPSGNHTSSATSLTQAPLYRLASALLISPGNVRLTDVIASCFDVIYSTANPSEQDVTAALNILGTFIETISVSHSEGSGKILKVDNMYVQTDEYTEKFLRFLRAYVTNKVPVLELQIRGNPAYLPGEKIRVVSERYNVDFTGILIRQHFKYTGSLSSTIRLFNSEVMEVL